MANGERKHFNMTPPVLILLPTLLNLEEQKALAVPTDDDNSETKRTPNETMVI